MKKILLAGGAGYIGSLLTEALLVRNYEVTIIDLFWFGDYTNKKASKIRKNIMDVSEDEIKGHDAVVFLGGLSNDPMAQYSPQMNFIENTAVPINLAYISKNAGIKKFVYASTCSVYGYTADKLISEVSTSLYPQFPYGISKLAAERAILNLKDENFKPIALRKGTVGGWSPRMRFDLVVNAMTKSALVDKKIIVNNPNIWRPIIDIRDVVKAYIRAIESSHDVTGVYNISQDNYTIGRLADEIKQEIENCYNEKIKIEIRNVQRY